MNDIHVTEDKSYTLHEVVDAVKQTLDAVGSSLNTVNFAIRPRMFIGYCMTCSSM